MSLACGLSVTRVVENAGEDRQHLVTMEPKFARVNRSSESGSLRSGELSAL